MHSPSDPSQPPAPRVLAYVRIYTVAVGLLYLCACALLTWLFASSPLPPGIPGALRLIRLAFVLLCAVLAAGFLAFPFLPSRPWLWGYGLACIVTGLTSVITIPFALPLLLSWTRPQTRAYLHSLSAPSRSAGGALRDPFVPK